MEGGARSPEDTEGGDEEEPEEGAGEASVAAARDAHVARRKAPGEGEDGAGGREAAREAAEGVGHVADGLAQVLDRVPLAHVPPASVVTVVPALPHTHHQGSGGKGGGAGG